MLIDFIARNVWVSIGIWAVLYMGDYMLTIIGAKLYHRGAKEHFTFEQGYELNPVFKKDIALLRKFSPRFLLFLFTTCILIFIVRFLSTPLPGLFTFLMGALILVEIHVHLRHMRNIVLFSIVLHRGGVQGSISYSGWLTYRISAMEFTSYAVLYLFIYLLTGNVFFLGGMATCFLSGAKHFGLSRKTQKQKRVKAEESAAVPADEHKGEDSKQG